MPIDIHIRISSIETFFQSMGMLLLDARTHETQNNEKNHGESERPVSELVKHNIRARNEKHQHTCHECRAAKDPKPSHCGSLSVGVFMLETFQSMGRSKP